ncbi:hypothetical protein ABEV54_12065 [Peribacillus psychrosaccharolyticus]|uniref:hypothetical protein n=1 Tax=Peribacillus psychrosaccharolyticus TaxID=1407 RepID=UPI003D274642
MIDVLYAFSAIVSSMRERKSGLLINLSSVVGNNIYPGGRYDGKKNPFFTWSSLPTIAEET